MTTITFKEDIWVKKDTFVNVLDFLNTIYSEVDFKEIDQKDVSQWLIDKINLSKKKDISSFSKKIRF
jgi:hypothetical protein